MALNDTSVNSVADSNIYDAENEIYKYYEDPAPNLELAVYGENNYHSNVQLQDYQNNYSYPYYQNYIQYNDNTTYYPQYYLPQTYSYPVVFPSWNTSPVPIPIYSTLPNTEVPTQGYTTICPYVNAVHPSQSNVCPMISNPMVPCPVPTLMPCGCICVPSAAIPQKEPKEPEPETINYQKPSVEESTESKFKKVDVDVVYDLSVHPIDFFLSLPKELFPTPKLSTMSPNSIIDQFCKIPSISNSLNWILDLELGIPRVPVARSVAIYNFKSKKIICKNTLSAHPIFEACNPHFKRAILYYYEYVIYEWYRGFVIINRDKSIDKFQSWLKLPMHLLGMCWR